MILIESFERGDGMKDNKNISVKAEGNEKISAETQAGAAVYMDKIVMSETITASVTADILYHAYESGDIDNIFYPGKWKDMSENIKQKLDNVELVTLGDVRENAYGVILWRPHHEINRNFIFSMVEENKGKNILPEITSLHFLIADKYFTVLKDGKKINASLYATPQKLSKLTESLAYELEQTKKDTPEYYNIRSLSWKIAIYNPLFYALKKEFPNTPIRDLCLVIEDYLNQTYKISQELIERSMDFNNIENWTDLFPRTKKDLEPLIAFARKRITQTNFISMPQNKITNSLISSFVDKPTAGQLDLLNGFEVEVNKNLILKFEDVPLDQTAPDLKPISVKTANGMKTLVILLREYSQHKNEKGNVRIPLSDIQTLRRYEDERTARRQTLAGITELSKIGFEVKDNKRFSGYRRLNGGDHYIKNGFVYWNWNPNFLPIIDDMKMSDFPIEGLATNDKTNPNAFYLTVFLSNSYRMNEGKTRQGKISVMSLIENCPDLKDKFDKGDKLKEKVMTPLIRDLDSLDWLHYDWYEPTGGKIDDIDSVKPKDFMKCYIMVDYSDFPTHEKRLAAKQRREKQNEKALANQRAKLQIKQEQQQNE